MHPRAIEHVKECLVSIRSERENLSKAKSLLEQERAWSRFLLEADKFYEKLKKGAATSGASNGWFGQKKHQRTKDELLKYIHFARNCDYHGLDSVTERRRGRVGVSGGDIEIQSMSRTDGRTRIRARAFGNSNIEIFQDPPTLRLLRVVDRFGNIANPPTSHLGISISAPTARKIVDLAITYFEEMLIEATKLAPKI